jgi:pSer/pThr/pTyr-binding forkhead associated (FHA) protein
MAILRVIGGPDIGRMAEVRDEPLTIGRGPDCGLKVTDEEVSLVHALVEPLEGLWRIRDLESLGGTVVNGKRAFEHRLMFGDIITLGQTLILFGSGNETVSPEAVGSAESPLCDDAGTA